jgi:hypothetical protein
MIGGVLNTIAIIALFFTLNVARDRIEKLEHDVAILNAFNSMKVSK